MYLLPRCLFRAGSRSLGRQFATFHIGASESRFLTAKCSFPQSPSLPLNYGLNRALSSGPHWNGDCSPLLVPGVGSIRFYGSDSGPGDPASKNKLGIADEPNKPDVKVQEVKPSLWMRFKQMYKEYWYVLIPVHLATSAVWIGAFYYVAISGIDIVPLLQKLGAGEFILKPLRDSGAGYYAVAYALYKIATPARYTVTLGGTTLSINYLKKWGVIKPMPSSEQMKVMFSEKKRELRSQRARALAKMGLRRPGGTKTKDPE